MIGVQILDEDLTVLVACWFQSFVGFCVNGLLKKSSSVFLPLNPPGGTLNLHFFLSPPWAFSPDQSVSGGWGKSSFFNTPEGKGLCFRFGFNRFLSKK